MHVVLATIGSGGDVHPFIALARALVARGHGATLVVNPAFEGAVKEAGVGYWPMADEVFDFSKAMTWKNVTHPRKGGVVVVRDMVLPESRRIFLEVTKAVRATKAAVVVAHHICLGAAWAAEKRGVPVVRVGLAPMAWFNPRDQIVLGDVFPKNPGRWTMRAGVWLARRMLAWEMDKAVNAARRDLGLPEGREWFLHESAGEGAKLGLWSPALRGPLPGDPAGGVVCGFPWHDRAAHPAFDEGETRGFLEACAAKGERAVVFTLGTAVVHGAGGYFHAAAEACKRLGVPGLLVCGREDLLPKRSALPAGVKVSSYAPFSAVFPLGGVNVHHGGIGTTAQGMRAGRPTVVTPVSYDQFDHAARLERMGVSATVHFAKVTGERLARAVRKVMEDAGAAAKAAGLARRLEGEDGAARGAEVVEGVVRNGR
jgi:UDP:flavonoid glycosyltransferase YjiC (YdhE family)